MVAPSGTADQPGFVLPPLPNSLFARDNTSWIFEGVTLNPMFWPARRQETLLTTAIYRFHPDFAGNVNVWWGDPTQDWGMATLEGGDVMPIGNATVLIGMSERTSRQAITQVAHALFTNDVFDALSASSSVARREVHGGTGPVNTMK